MIINILLALIILGIVVFFHELGHFIFAKKVGIKVYTFSIGFGPKIWGVKYKGTLYKLSLIPFGGYVSMAGEEIDDRTGDKNEFASKSLWERFQVIFAGPMTNFILAFLLMWVVLMIGIEEPVDKKSPMEVYVKEGSIAHEIGLETGDEIISVNGKKIGYWHQFLEEVSLTSGKATIRWKDKDQNKIKINKINFKRDEYTGGVDTEDLGLSPLIKTEIAKVEKNSPADNAGIKSGDIITRVNGEKVEYSHEVSNFIKKLNNKKKLSIKVLRNGEIINLNAELKKRKNNNGFYLGVLFNYNIETQVVKYSFFKAFYKGGERFVNWIVKIYDMLKLLVTGSTSVKTISGPVAIVKVTSIFAELGLSSLLNFLSLISLNLGIVNLLPIPIADGGQILFILIEKIKGEPINEKTISIIMQISTLILISLAIFITYNDIIKIIKGVL